MAGVMRVECVRQGGPVARAVLRWGALAAALAAAGLLALPVSSYWLWVAESAFLGIREAADPKLGVISVAFAALPVVAGAASWFWCGRRRNWSRVLRGASALSAATAASFVSAIAAAFATFP